MNTSLDDLVTQVRASAKYAQVNADLVRRIGAAELAKRRSFKEAVKETKNTLHQVAGMFAGEKPPYGAWLAEVETRDRASLRQVMSHHASTRERLPILDSFYATIFAGLHPIHSMLDVACGLNPLAIPWMGLAQGATYHAVDIYDDMMAFLQTAFNGMGVNGKAESRDVVADCPSDPVDVALVLKAIPCLEQLDKRAGRILLDTIRARHVVVSFPTRTVGGRSIGMRGHYEAHFNELIAGRSVAVKRHEFENELIFVLSSE
jgi:16S rRNA (guanine(1405)-N(7))-methyltransferase